MAESAVYVLEKMAHGYRRMGRAHGAGFFDYSSDGTATLWSGLKTFERGVRAPSATEAIDRLRLAVALEAVRCLETGAAPAEVDAATASTGMPLAGGVVAYLNATGAQAVVAQAMSFADRLGERFAPPALLHSKAREGGTLS